MVRGILYQLVAAATGYNFHVENGAATNLIFNVLVCGDYREQQLSKLRLLNGI